MLSCKEISQLYSQSLERQLPWRARLGVWMHLMMCRWCRGFARQLQLLRKASHRYAAVVEQDSAETLISADDSLSPEARSRIQQTIEKTDL